MKKIALISLVALFAINAAHAVGTVVNVTPLGAGATNIIASQSYVHKNINDQVGAEEAARKSADGDLQFTGAAAAATDITKAINAVDAAVTTISSSLGNYVSDVAASATDGNISVTKGETTTNVAVKGVQLTSNIVSSISTDSSTGNSTSTDKYTSVKSVVDYVTNAISGVQIEYEADETSLELDGNMFSVKAPATTCTAALTAASLNSSTGHCNLSFDITAKEFVWEVVVH
jgi:hypothetical protein